MGLNPNVPNLKLSLAERAWLARSAGFTGDGAATIVAISESESGGVTNAYRDASQNPNGGNDRGVLQWNSKWNPDISDGAAYNPWTAFQWAYRKSSNGTNFGMWSPAGPAGYSSAAAADAAARERINAGDLAAARSAVQNPVDPTRRLAAVGWSPAGGSTSPLAADGSGFTPGEVALLTSWDTNGDGKLNRDDLPDRLTDEQVAGLTDAQRKKIRDVGKEFVTNDGQIKPGFLAATKAALGFPPTATLLEPAREYLRFDLVGRAGDRASGSGRWFNIPIPGVGTVSIPGSGQTVSDTLSAVGDVLTPDWAEALARVLGNLASAEWWKRIGIGAAGVALIVIAIAWAGRKQIAGAVNPAVGAAMA